ncbi:unnamed protein product, partial [marine sediment metagenome]
LTITAGADVAEEIHVPDDFDLNAIYVDMLGDALAGFAESPARAAIPLADGVAALDMAAGALESSRSKKAVRLVGACR